MTTTDVILGRDCIIDSSSSVNNAQLGDNVKIAKRCSIFGAPDMLLEIGSHTYIGMNSAVMGFAAKITIGAYVSIAQNVYIMADSGPNNELLQRIFPVIKAPVSIGDLCWLGNGAVIMPGVTLGRACVVGANSFVNSSFEDYSVIGGTPAKLIRKLSKEEIEKINH